MAERWGVNGDQYLGDQYLVDQYLVDQYLGDQYLVHRTLCPLLVAVGHNALFISPILPWKGVGCDDPLTASNPPMVDSGER
ncbi:unnamed protein product [Merluccius merluccius]